MAVKKKPTKKKSTKKKPTKERVVDFKGKVLSSTYDFQTATTDVAGPHYVWYPDSPADVATAVTLSQKHKTFVRSGTQVARQDTVDGSGGIVINLSELDEITVKKKVVKAEAAATSEALVKYLSEHNLALPIIDNPLKSIASCVLNEGISNLTRSLGKLSGYVTEISAVEPDGTPITFKAGTDESCQEQCLASKAVITEVTFKAVSAKSLWMLRCTSLYPGYDDFLGLARALFLDIDVPDKCDLVLDAYSGPHGMPIVSITALGSKKGKASMKKLVSNSFQEKQCRQEIPSSSGTCACLRFFFEGSVVG